MPKHEVVCIAVLIMVNTRRSANVPTGADDWINYGAPNWGSMQVWKMTMIFMIWYEGVFRIYYFLKNHNAHSRNWYGVMQQQSKHPKYTHHCLSLRKKVPRYSRKLKIIKNPWVPTNNKKISKCRRKEISCFQWKVGYIAEGGSA